MSGVTTIRSAEDYAKEFVERYHKETPLAAAKWIHEFVPEEYHDKLREPIHREFLRLGYTFPEVD